MTQTSIADAEPLAYCALCCQQRDLLESHIIPKFIFKWQKDTSATGYLRSSKQPNMRVQDGLKTKLLCHECEQLFSGWESQFANRIFYPYHQGLGSDFSYETWLPKCFASITWRCLTFLDRQREPSGLERARGDVQSSLATWKAFLHGQRPDVGKHQLHLLPLRSTQMPMDKTSCRMHSYLWRAVSFGPVVTGDTSIVVVKLGLFFLVGIINEPESDRWEGTSVDLRSGTIDSRHITIPDWLLWWIQSQGQYVDEINNSITDRQRQIVCKTMDNDPTRVLASETLKAHLADISSSQSRDND